MVPDNTLPELEPYILGKKYFPKQGVQSHNKLAVDEFSMRVSKSMSAKINLDMCEQYTDFYKVEPDFKHWIKPEDRAEAFYANKVGKYTPLVPSFCVYLLKKAYEVHKSPNLVVKQLPVPVLEKFLSDGYFGGLLTLRDVICNFCNPNYNPLSLTRLKNPCGDFTEVYVKSTDMVALVPKRLASLLNDESILEIEVAPNGLAVRGKTLTSLAGYHGIVNSIYDLRKLV